MTQRPRWTSSLTSSRTSSMPGTPRSSTPRTVLWIRGRPSCTRTTWTSNIWLGKTRIETPRMRGLARGCHLQRKYRRPRSKFRRSKSWKPRRGTSCESSTTAKLTDQIGPSSLSLGLNQAISTSHKKSVTQSTTCWCKMTLIHLDTPNGSSTK